MKIMEIKDSSDGIFQYVKSKSSNQMKRLENSFAPIADKQLGYFVFCHIKIAEHLGYGGLVFRLKLIHGDFVGAENFPLSDRDSSIHEQGLKRLLLNLGVLVPHERNIQLKIDDHAFIKRIQQSRYEETRKDNSGIGHLLNMFPNLTIKSVFPSSVSNELELLKACITERITNSHEFKMRSEYLAKFRQSRELNNEIKKQRSGG